MILKSIRLKNIRSYTEQTIEFPPGSILLAGDIGSGKSSILHAVEFALFGARRDSISGEALLRKGEKSGEVEILFELDGKQVSAKRTLKKQQDSVAQDSGYISVDGERIEGTSTELKARMLQLLGYPKELLTKSKSLIYRYTVYTPQEEMKQIIFDDTDQRADTLRKVFGIDRYKRISENAEIFVKSMKERKKELVGMTQGIEEKSKELEARKSELEKAESSRKETSPLLDETKRKKTAKREEILSIERKITELNELRKKSEVCNARMRELVKHKASNEEEFSSLGLEAARIRKKLDATFLEERQFPPAEQVEKEMAALEREMGDAVKRKAELEERGKQIAMRVEHLSNEIIAKSLRTAVADEKEMLYKELLEEIKDKEIISEAIKEMGSRLKATEAAISELSANRKNSEAAKSRMSGLVKCPTCRQEVPDTHKHSVMDEEERNLRKITAELDQLNTQKNEIQKMLDGNNKKLQALSEKEMTVAATKVELSNINAIKQELLSIRQMHAALNKEKIEIIKALEQSDQHAIEEMQRILEEKKGLLKEMNSYQLLLREKKHNLQRIAEKEQRKELLLKQQEQLSNEISKLDSEKKLIGEKIFRDASLEQFYRQEKEDLDKLNDAERLIEVRLGEINKEIEGTKKMMDSLLKDILAKENALSKIGHINSVQQWVEEMFLNLMATMEKQIMARAHTHFSELFSTWFGLLIEDENISVMIDDTFSPVVTQNGYDTDISHLSGGEKTAVALAYRLALNKVINDIMSSIKTKDLLILDEPTDGFSSEQLDKVRNVLDELDMKQTIIVSHEAKIESFVDHVIRVHKTEHVSRVVS